MKLKREELIAIFTKAIDGNVIAIDTATEFLETHLYIGDYDNLRTIDAETSLEVEKQKDFLKKEFNMDIVVTPSMIPVKPEGTTRLIVVPKGFKSKIVLDKLASKDIVITSKYEDLDTAYPSGRNPNNKSYAIWVNDEDSGEIHSVLRCSMTEETLLEHLLHELIYFSEKATLLNIDSVFCKGSEGAQGTSTPIVTSINGEVRIKSFATVRDVTVRVSRAY